MKDVRRQRRCRCCHPRLHPRSRIRPAFRPVAHSSSACGRVAPVWERVVRKATKTAAVSETEQAKKKRCEKAAMIPYITTGAIVSANKENKNVNNEGNDCTSGEIKPSHHLSILLELGSYPPFPSSHHTLVNTPARSTRRQITLQQPPSPNLPRWKTDGSSPEL